MNQLPEQILCAAGIPVYLRGFSAIDAYLERNSAAAVYIVCGANLAEIACLFEDLRYPGAAFADAAVDSNNKTWYFRCEDSLQISKVKNSFSFLEFYQDCKTRRFYDPNGIYPCLRRIKYLENSDSKPWQNSQNYSFSSPYRTLFDMAMILAKYFPETGIPEIHQIAAGLSPLAGYAPPSTEEQRVLLTEMLDTANPCAGFELLRKCGFIAAHWPELAALNDVDHSKEFHPEGNGWKHTMETLPHRKANGRKTGFNLKLSLGLLLHDCGKPLSNAAGSKRFFAHAELGERQARKFLERLGFDKLLIRDVCYLVRNHMLPAALPKLPLKRTGEIMESDLFPLLMELYRCDESSSFKGLDGYYRSSAAYQSYLKHRRNPYRSLTARQE